MKVTFKQFSSYVDLPEDQITEEQLDEIFGIFSNEKKKQELAQQRISLIQKKKDAEKAAQATKEKMLAQRKPGAQVAGNQTGPKPYDEKPGPMNAAKARAAERDWASNLATESVMSGIDEVFQELVAGDREIYDVMNHPKGQDEQKAAKMLSKMYDEVAIDHDLHPDDDFEKIEKIMMKELDKKYQAPEEDLDESAQLAIDLVKGNKIAPGIMNKLDRWFMKLSWFHDKNRFLSAAEAKNQLSLAGFTPHQVSLVRDVAADAGYAAMERIKHKYPKEVKGYMADNKYSFQVADLFLNVGENIRNEFHDLMQKLFIEKMKRRADEFELKEGAVSRKEFTSIEDLDESAQLAIDLVKGDKIAPGIMNKLNRWFITLCWAPDKNRFLRAAEAKTQLSLAGFTPHQVSLVRDVAADAGYAAMERIKNMYPKEVKGYMTDNKYSFQVADLFWNVNEDIRNEFYDLMQKLFIEKMKRRAKEFELKEGAVSRKEFTSIEAWTKAVKANEYDIESWGQGSKSAHNDDGRNVGEWVADFDCDNDERPHGWLKVKPVKD